MRKLPTNKINLDCFYRTLSVSLKNSIIKAILGYFKSSLEVLYTVYTVLCIKICFVKVTEGLSSKDVSRQMLLWLYMLQVIFSR